MQDILSSSKHTPISSSDNPQSKEATPPEKTEHIFKTPEQTAKEDAKSSVEYGIMNTSTLCKTTKKPFLRVKLDKKERLLFVTGTILLLTIIIGVYAVTGRTDPLHIVTSTYIPTAPKDIETAKIYSELSGMEITDKSLNEEPVTAVMIENSKEARPQAGLIDAGIVFEAIAEGGITRFVALYQETAPSYVGPIRSVRPYYLDFILPFKASLAHVGGSPEALDDIKKLGIADLDEFYNASSYTRVTSRYAPHNAYTSLEKLNNLEKTKGSTDAEFIGFARKDEAPATTPNATNIIVAISGGIYNSSYSYNKESNKYFRNQGGVAHIDETTKQQISPKVIVVMEISRGISSDGEHTKYHTVGSGKITVFQDGNALQGTWTKNSRSSEISLKDENGNDLLLNRGQTWFVAIDSITSNLSYGL